MNTKVLILGASGIVGQHLRRHQPEHLQATYTSRQALPWQTSVMVDFKSDQDVEHFCDYWDADVVLNLIGENRPDVVEAHPDQYWFQNVEIPLALKRWSERRQRWLIHISTQAVFGGMLAPYTAAMAPEEVPVNHYGRQKLKAEQLMMMRLRETLVVLVRLTFMLGVRPFPGLGRPNPLEHIYQAASKLDPELLRQVSDRWFSPCFANNAACFLWQLIGTMSPLDPYLERFLARKRIFNIGLSMRMSRADITAFAAANLRHQQALKYKRRLVEPVKHDKEYGKLAQRPLDTTFASDAVHDESWDEALNVCTAEWRICMDRSSEHDRALELAMFLGIREGEARVQLMRGFGALHGDVANDYRQARSRKVAWSDFDLLMWYKQTNAYLWELTAYHLDAGFNYTGMSIGIAQRLHGELFPGANVLALGDGIGDFSITLMEHGLTAIYNDLLGSQTARFAAFRFQRRGMNPVLFLSEDWTPVKQTNKDFQPIHAVIALDFFEHLPNVEEWVKGMYDILEPGGIFLAQNGFAMGDDEHGGSIPMHLTRNNHYETDWDPLLEKTGFKRMDGTWWRK